MRVTAPDLKVRVHADPAATRPVCITLFGARGLRLALTNTEALDLANRLVDAAEKIDRE